MTKKNAKTKHVESCFPSFSETVALTYCVVLYFGDWFEARGALVKSNHYAAKIILQRAAVVH